MLDSPRACINTLQTKAPGSLVMKLFEAKGFYVSKKHKILKMFQLSVFLLQINIKTWKVFTRIPKNLLKFVENLSRSSNKTEIKSGFLKLRLIR